MAVLDPQLPAQLGTLQSLDDAIAYRQGRLSRPCPDCGPGGRCAEHATDKHLIAAYQGRHATACRDALAGLDPGDVALITQPGDAMPTTADVLSLVVITRLREAAAAGPAVIELDGCPVLIELDGQVVVEHPIHADAGYS